MPPSSYGHTYPHSAPLYSRMSGYFDESSLLPPIRDGWRSHSLLVRPTDMYEKIPGTGVEVVNHSPVLPRSYSAMSMSATSESGAALTGNFSSFVLSPDQPATLELPTTAPTMRCFPPSVDHADGYAEEFVPDTTYQLHHSWFEAHQPVEPDPLGLYLDTAPLV